ncbi:MAG: hypothetical protein PVG65_05765 [Candidatus Thorarchaeota archaeon]|jgi:hypothetical protein
MITLNAAKEHSCIEIGEECEIYAVTAGKQLFVKSCVTGAVVGYVPCDVFGLEPNKVLFLLTSNKEVTND